MSSKKSDGKRHPFERALLARARALFPEGGTVVVGVSGGPDSTALLLGLAPLSAELGARVVAAHLDHGLRGEEARRDRDFVRDLAARLGCRFVEGKATDLALRAKGRGIEAAAREARYAFLQETAERLGAGRVAVAHTLTDQAETVLLRVLRGAGLRGLAAMPESRSIARGSRVRLVRPLLGTSREEVVAYLKDRGVVAREDAMNRDPRFKRTRVRRELLPLAASAINPRAEEALARAAQAARSASRFLEREARRLLRLAGPDLSVKTLARADSALLEIAVARLLRARVPERLTRLHVNAVSRLVRSPGHGEVALPGSLSARVENGKLMVTRARPFEPEPEPEPGLFPLQIPIPGRALDPLAGLIFEARVVRGSPHPKKDDPSRLARFDRARVRGRLAVRRRREGDRFRPLGSRGQKTLKRFFIDRKIPRALRERVPIVTLDDLPIWVVGERIDDRFKVTPETREVLELRATPSGELGDLS